MAFEEEEPPGAPEWIVTFSDMISLLVTFFVLLLTFASVETKDEQKMKQFLRGMWGVFPAENGSAVDLPNDEISPDRTYRVSASYEKSSRPFEDVLHELERGGLRLDDERLPIDLSTLTTGIRLTFDEDARFAPGDAVPSAALDRALVRIADVVRHYPLEVVVEARGDAARRGGLSTEERRALSLARAAAVADVLTRSGKLDPGRVALTDLDSHLPLGAGTPDRGVELRLVPVEGL